MHVGSHWVHGTPSGSSALRSTFGSVSGAGPASVPSASRMKGRPRFGPTFNLLLHVVCTAVVPRPMMLKSIHVIARIVRLRAEGHTAALPKGTRTVQPRLSLKPRPCPTRGSMPGLFADFLTFAPLSVRTPHYTRPVIVFRLSLMGSTFTLVWFVLVQILLYSSSSTCRRSSPHLWWLTFGVLCVMYVMILEVVVVAILVFVVGPILFVRYNNFLCSSA